LNPNKERSGKTSVSIITPVLNGERFVEGCLKSVIAQNCLEAEHIIVDGQSNDQTIRIVKDYAMRYSHIRWISEPDTGISEALNKGIKMAKGGIMGVLNADDYYEPNVFHRVIKIMQTMTVPTLLVGNCKIWNDQGKCIRLNKPSLDLTELLLYGYRANFPENASAYFYHTVVHEIIGCFDENEPQLMDIDFLLRAIRNISTKHVNEVWGNFRLIEGTKTRKAIASGQLPFMMDKMIEAHTAKLPLLYRFYIKSVRWIKNSYFVKRAHFYLRNPAQLISFFKRRVESVFLSNKSRVRYDQTD
jgi:glycosyltransferase involved in cell wall biosynthesis